MAETVLTNISKYFGTTAVLRDINLQIGDGEFMIFVGPSGSGKSTLLRILAGLEEVSSGTVFIGGQDVTSQPPKNRQVAMVFQNYALYPHMTVAQNITFGMRVRKEKKVSQQAALERVVKLLHLQGLLERKPRQLSGGQRQRVAMARAIVHTPRLFLMDEPLSNLDAKLRNDIRISIMELRRQLGCTMVYVTHDQIEAMTMADRVAVLDRGIIQQIGTPQQLYHQPDNTFTAGFIGTPGMNFITLHRHDNQLCLPDKTILPRCNGLHSLLDRSDKIVLGIRPEHLHCRPDQTGHDHTDTAGEIRQQTIRWPSTIHSYEMLGPEFLIHTQEENGHLRFRRKNNGALPIVGEQITLQFTLDTAHFFDGITGKRLHEH